MGERRICPWQAWDNDKRVKEPPHAMGSEPRCLRCQDYSLGREDFRRGVVSDLRMKGDVYAGVFVRNNPPTLPRGVACTPEYELYGEKFREAASSLEKTGSVCTPKERDVAAELGVTFPPPRKGGE